MANMLGIVRKAFPFIAAAASMAANAVGAALKMNSPLDGTADAIAGAIAGATPDQMVALKEAEIALQAQLAQLGFAQTSDLENIAAQDRANARARQIAVKDRTPAVLAWTVTAGFFAILVMVARWGVAPQVHDLVIALIGSLGTAWTGIVTYYFGSSAGSAAKTQILAQNAAVNGGKSYCVPGSGYWRSAAACPWPRGLCRKKAPRRHAIRSGDEAAGGEVQDLLQAGSLRLPEYLYVVNELEAANEVIPDRDVFWRRGDVAVHAA